MRNDGRGFPFSVVGAMVDEEGGDGGAEAGEEVVEAGANQGRRERRSAWRQGV